MDWEAAIGRNRAALLRIVAALFAMAGLAEGRAAVAAAQTLRPSPSSVIHGPRVKPEDDPMIHGKTAWSVITPQKPFRQAPARPIPAVIPVLVTGIHSRDRRGTRPEPDVRPSPQQPLHPVFRVEVRDVSDLVLMDAPGQIAGDAGLECAALL